jgi:hypothetical protein
MQLFKKKNKGRTSHTKNPHLYDYLKRRLDNAEPERTLYISVTDSGDIDQCLQPFTTGWPNESG